MDAATFPKYLKEQNIDHQFMTPYVYQKNGQLERYMRTVKNVTIIETPVLLRMPERIVKGSVNAAATSFGLPLLLIPVNLKSVFEDLTRVCNPDLDKQRMAESTNLAILCSCISKIQMIRTLRGPENGDECYYKSDFKTGVRPAI